MKTTAAVKWFALCAALAFGEAVAFMLPFMHPAWPTVAVAGVLVTLFAFGCRWRFWPLPGVFFAGAVIAWSCISERTRTIVELTELNRGKPVESAFKIPSSVKCYEESHGFRKVVFPSEVRDIEVIVNLYVPAGEVVPKEGETWLCRGWMGRETRDGLFGRRRFWVRGNGSEAKRVEDSSSRSSVDGFVARTRSEFSSRVGAGLRRKSEVEVLNKALLLGERSHIDPETRKAFVDSGMAHLFAVSGLHVLIIAKFFSVLLSFTGFPARFRAIVLIPLIWFYVLLVGAGPSAVRAGMMASLCWTAALFWRRSDPLTAWAQTFALVHVFSPEMLISTGSQLSFAVMLGLVMWNHIAKGVKGNFVRMFAPTAVAWIFGVPIIAATFAVITPGGLFVNIIAVPIAGLSVVLTALGVTFSYVSSFLAGVFSAAAHMTTSVLLALAHLAGAMGWSNFEIEKWSLLECAAWYMATALVMWAIYDYRRRPSVKY